VARKLEDTVPSKESQPRRGRDIRLGSICGEHGVINRDVSSGDEQPFHSSLVAAQGELSHERHSATSRGELDRTRKTAD